MSSQGPRESDTRREKVLPKLEAAGWVGESVREEVVISPGRIQLSGRGYSRGRLLRADYVLIVGEEHPVGVVEAKREYKSKHDALQQAIRYAERLDAPLAFGTNGDAIIERDLVTGAERELADFPDPSHAWDKAKQHRGVEDPLVDEWLRASFNRRITIPTSGVVKMLRYYQQVAVHRTLTAIGRGNRRILLLMATGTGKTFTAMQLVHTLYESSWNPGRRPRILYLADRNILIDQPIAREFRPAFGDGPLHKITKGEAATSREIYFALYQSLMSGEEEGAAVYTAYPPDFFDLIIVDECHRGSSNADSQWRRILEYFDSAIQVGMTATPVKHDNTDTFEYFGLPIYEYSLKQGIEDGFLAPYRVRRVVTTADAFGWTPEPGQRDLYGNEIPDELYTTQDFDGRLVLVPRTETVARHVSEYLRSTNPFAKTIIFCRDSEHAARMRFALVNANAGLVRDHPDYVVRIVAAEGDVGQEHLDNFSDPERTTPVLATTSRLLSTGVDITTVKNIVLFRPVGSMAEFKQIIGRGTRIDEDYGKVSFEIIDYVYATRKFNDPEFDGHPVATVEEPLEPADAISHAEMPLDEPIPVLIEESLSGAGGVGDEPDEAAGRPRFYVEEGQVGIVAESVHVPDVGGGQLRLIEYLSYAGQEVRTLFGSSDELRARWRQATLRGQATAALTDRGIDIAELAQMTSLVDADPLDILVYVAWQGPPLTRRERVERMRREHAEFLASYQEEARVILESLLDSYAEHGPQQLDGVEVLKVQPFIQYGSLFEIAERFGGPAPLHLAFSRLSELLYAA